MVKGGDETSEGVWWIRGHHNVDSESVQVLLAACALVGTW